MLHRTIFSFLRRLYDAPLLNERPSASLPLLSEEYRKVNDSITGSKQTLRLIRQKAFRKQNRAADREVQSDVPSRPRRFAHLKKASDATEFTVSAVPDNCDDEDVGLLDLRPADSDYDANKAGGPESDTHSQHAEVSLLVRRRTGPATLLEEDATDSVYGLSDMELLDFKGSVLGS